MITTELIKRTRLYIFWRREREREREKEKEKEAVRHVEGNIVILRFFSFVNQIQIRHIDYLENKIK
jgi:hypothetical protein